jgi:hypothetical protein
MQLLSNGDKRVNVTEFHLTSLFRATDLQALIRLATGRQINEVLGYQHLERAACQTSAAEVAAANSVTLW